MTNREWIKQKKDKINEKINNCVDWILGNLWCPIIIIGVFIVMIIIGTLLIDSMMCVLLIPTCALEYLFVDLVMDDGLDKEHKEKNKKGM